MKTSRTKKTWVRGYDQQLRHLIVKTEHTSRYSRTYFACGKSTDYTLDYVYEIAPSPKCPTCIAFEKKHS
jgi:hypothetical protein